MRNHLFRVYCFVFGVFIFTYSNAQHITIPIHHSKWIPNYASADSIRGITTFSHIPIAFYMDSANGKVKQYEKLEIGIKLPQEAKLLISNFIRNGRGINPFDPEQIKISAEFYHFENLPKNSNYAHFISEECHQISEAFYYEEFRQVMSDDRYKHGYWKKDTTSYNFRIRFAPRKTGWWICTINIWLEGKLKYTLPSFDFLCTPGNSNGFITGISKNKRLLQFENGENFFGIGQNIPLADLNNAIKPQGLSKFKDQPPHGFQLQRKYMEELANKGGNLVRIMNGEWVDAIEWEKLNDYSMNMNVAWEQDRTFDLCREKNIFLLWAMQYHSALMYHNPYGNDALAWPSSPYHTELRIEKPEDFFTNEKAIKFYQHKIRYQLSRWGYSRMIAGLQLINEINEVASDPQIHYHPYFNDTSFRNKVGKWHLIMKKYIQQELNYPFLIGGSFTGDVGANVGDDEVMRNSDFIDYHPYGQDRNINLGARFGGINYIPGYGIFKRYQKPVIIGEMGVWDTEFLNECSENGFHNDIWATAFMGGWAGGLHWHNWEDNYNQNLRDNFTGLNKFLTDHPMTDREGTPHRWPEKNLSDTTYSVKEKNYFEALYLTSGKKLFKHTNAIGWIHNRSAYWYNLSDSECEKNIFEKKSIDKKDKKHYRPHNDDSGELIRFKYPEDKEKLIVKISGLQRLKNYYISFTNTVTGKTDYYYMKFHWFGKMKIIVPPEYLHEKYQDVAFHVYRKKDTNIFVKF